jgi:quinol monooxygenase YgiN
MVKPYLQVIAHYYVKRGHGESVAALLGELATATRDEPKNLYYDYFRSPADPDHFVILEQYSDANGLAEHRETAHFQRIGLQSIVPLLARREVASHMVNEGAA